MEISNQKYVENQIEVLEKTLKHLKEYGYPYICNISGSIYYFRFKNVYFMSSSEFLPLLTFENAMMVCKKYKLKQPVERHPDGNGWWAKGLKKPRIAFVNWMIRELKK